MSNTFSFNLLDEPWLPFVRADGTTAVLGIREALAHAHQLDLVAGDSPLQTAAIYRLLLALVMRIYAPADIDEWADLREAQRFNMEQANEYFDRWIDRFDLFNERHPFMQRDERRVEAKSIINLLQDRASGNNATLFDHSLESDFTTLMPAEAARALLAIQTFGLAGLCHPQLKLNYTDSPCASAVIFVVLGQSLHETLLLNLLYDGELMTEYQLQSDADKPVWERSDPLLPARSQPDGVLDLLTWPARSLRLEPMRDVNGQIVVPALRMAPGLRLNPDFIEPMTQYQRDEKKGYLVQRFTEDRALWRDSVTLLSIGRPQSPQNLPPAALTLLREAIHDGVLPQQRVFRVAAFGMARDQAKINFFRSEQLPVPAALLEAPQLAERLKGALAESESAAGALDYALRVCGIHLFHPVSKDGGGPQWAELGKPQKDEIRDWIAHTGALRRYWTALDIPFQALVTGLPTDGLDAEARWRDGLRAAAEAAFANAADQLADDPRGLKARARGRGTLFGGLYKLFPSELKESTHDPV